MRSTVIILLCMLIVGDRLFAQSIPRLMEKHYKAHNQPFWEQINTISADVEWTSEIGVFHAEFMAKEPRMVMIKSVKDRFIEANDGEQNWTLAAWTKEEVSEMELERAFILNNLMSFGSPLPDGDHLTFRGMVEVDQRRCEWIEWADDSRKEEHFIDHRTHLLYKSVITEQFGDETITLTRTVNKYRAFNGIQFPTIIKMRTNTFESDYVFDGIVLGEGIPSSRFSKPDEL